MMLLETMRRWASGFRIPLLMAVGLVVVLGATLIPLAQAHHLGTGDLMSAVPSVNEHDISGLSHVKDNACGVAAATLILDYYLAQSGAQFTPLSIDAVAQDVPETYNENADGSYSFGTDGAELQAGLTKASTDPNLGVNDPLTGSWLSTDSAQWFPALQTELDAHRPVVIFLDDGSLLDGFQHYGHYIVVSGYTANDDIIVRDPWDSTKAHPSKVVANATFERIWAATWMGNNTPFEYMRVLPPGAAGSASTPTPRPTATPTSAPAQTNVYIGDANDGTLHAFNASDGAQLWTFQAGGQSAQALAVANSIVYVGEIDSVDVSYVTSRVYAVDAANGALLWHIDGVPTTSGELGNGNVLTFDALDNGLVYLSLGNNITAFDAQSGHQKWQYNPGSDTISAFALSGATLYVAHDNHGANPMLDAVNAISGSTLWSKATANPVVSNGVAADANTVYVAESDGGPGSYTGNVDVGDVGVEAFRGDSGQHRWRYDGGTEFGIALWVSGERVYVTDIGMEGGGFLALDAGTGKTAWTPQLNGCNSQDPYPTQNAAYDICTNYDTQQESVAALDPATGHVNWYQTSFGNDAVSDLFVSDGNLYAWGGVTYALDPGTGTIRWHKPGTFVAAGQGIFVVFDAAGNCTVYTAFNGMQIWHFAAGTLGAQVYTPPVLIG